MANVIVSTAAAAEIDDARAYDRQNSLITADGFIDEVHEALALIADNPGLWPPDEDDARYRFFALRRHSYVIHYRLVDAENVRVVAVTHSSRRPGHWKGR